MNVNSISAFFEYACLDFLFILYLYLKYHIKINALIKALIKYYLFYEKINEYYIYTYAIVHFAAAQYLTAYTF